MQHPMEDFSPKLAHLVLQCLWWKGLVSWGGVCSQLNPAAVCGSLLCFPVPVTRCGDVLLIVIAVSGLGCHVLFLKQGFL